MDSHRPNILVIMADQLAAQFLPAYGHKVVKTPHLNRLADSGVVFDHAYTPSPLCAPARATFMAGRLPSRTGVTDNAAEFPSSIPTFAHHLRLEGYRTCLSGKMHFVGPDQLHGFEERLTTDIYPADFGWTPDWRLRQERIDWWYHNMTSVKQAGVAEITNQIEYDDEVAFLAVRRLYDHARYEPEKPLCLVVSFTHPHDPYAARPEFWNLYSDRDIDMPAVPPIPDADLDPHSARLRQAYAMSEYEITEDDVRNARHGYYANISYIDAKIGELLATLDACGMRDDTAILVTSDHGDFLGERGLWYKMSFLEPSARIPLILSWARRFKPRRVREPASLADIAPTLAELAGRPGIEADGASLVPYADGSDEPRTIHGEYLAEGVTAPMFMLRRGSWKFVRCAGDPDQLFDLAADPLELENLAADPRHAAVLKEFSDECDARWDAGRLKAEVEASQRARLMLFQALRKGAHFPWDYQPLRKASEQYTRNHMDVTERDRRSRLPPAPEPKKRGW